MTPSPGAGFPGVNPHGLKNTGLGLLDGFSQSIDAREVFAVSVVSPSFALDDNGIRVRPHAVISSQRRNSQVSRKARALFRSESGARHLTHKFEKPQGQRAGVGLPVSHKREGGALP